MDASDALTDLRSRFEQPTAGHPTVRRALAVFSEYAAESVTFEGGSNDEDWVTISLDIVTPPEDWDIGVGPLTAGCVAITMDRNMYLADADGDFELCAQTGVVLVLAPSPGQVPTALAPGPNLDVEWNEPRDVEDLASVDIEDAEALVVGIDQVVRHGHHVLAWAQEHASLEDWVSQRRLDKHYDYATLQLAGVQSALDVPDAGRARSQALALSDPDCAAAAERLQRFIDSGRKMPQTVADLATVPPDIHRSPELVSVAPARLLGPAGLLLVARSALRVARSRGTVGPWRRRPD